MPRWYRAFLCLLLLSLKTCFMLILLLMLSCTYTLYALFSCFSNSILQSVIKINVSSIENDTMSGELTGGSYWQKVLSKHHPAFTSCYAPSFRIPCNDHFYQGSLLLLLNTMINQCGLISLFIRKFQVVGKNNQIPNLTWNHHILRVLTNHIL